MDVANKDIILKNAVNLHNLISACIKQANTLSSSGVPVSAFSDPNLSVKYTFDKPKISNWRIIEKKYQSLINELKLNKMDSILVGEKTLCRAELLKTELPTLREIIRLGKSAIRLNGQQDLRWLTRAAKQDLRGYLNLSDLLKKYSDIGEIKVRDLSSGLKKQLRGMCNNSFSENECKQTLISMGKTETNLVQAFDTWKAGSQNLYDSFFQIPSYYRIFGVSTIRTEDHFHLSVPFFFGQFVELRNRISEGVREHWNISGLSIELYEKLESVSSRAAIYSGVSSHVAQDNLYGPKSMNLEYDDALGDKNKSLDTIAHEFGHILGFPDCYLEFYDSDENAIVNYSLSEDDIMCAANGIVKPSHIDELKRVYR